MIGAVLARTSGKPLVCFTTANPLSNRHALPRCQLEGQRAATAGAYNQKFCAEVAQLYQPLRDGEPGSFGFGVRTVWFPLAFLGKLLVAEGRRFRLFRGPHDCQDVRLIWLAYGGEQRDDWRRNRQRQIIT